MSAGKLKAPAVAVPTLRASTTIVGSGLFKSKTLAATVGHPTDAAKAPHVWLHDEGDTVFIDELVNGVQQFQQQEQAQTKRVPQAAAPADGKSMRIALPHSLSPSSVAETKRSRSPRATSATQERKPWGFHQAPALSTPRARPQSPHPQTEPRREHHATQSGTATERSPAGAQPLKRSSSAHNHLKGAASPQHVSPPTNRSANTNTASSPKTQAAAALSSELLSSLNFHVKSIDERVSQADARAAAAEDKARILEKEMVAMAARHEADMAAVREKMLQLTAQLQYALHWINNFDTVAARQSEDAFLEEDCSAAGPAAGPGLASGRSAASCSVIRRLNLSTESSTFRLPPSPPMTLEQK